VRTLIYKGKTLINKWRLRRLRRLARLLKVELNVTPGVDLRIAIDGQLMLDADSDYLYWLGIWGGMRTEPDGWMELLNIMPAPLPPGSSYKTPLRPGTSQIFVRPRPRREELGADDD
jgi:hypothetical protein